jgi:predicted nuclease of restriction endonuclease-like (RecB) superfamily
MMVPEGEQGVVTAVERLSRDIKVEFPNVKGFSARNLWEMRFFYESYQGDTILQQLVAELPWGHNLVILHAAKDPEERKWYINKTIEHGWSRVFFYGRAIPFGS